MGESGSACTHRSGYVACGERPVHQRQRLLSCRQVIAREALEGQRVGYGTVHAPASTHKSARTN